MKKLALTLSSLFFITLSIQLHAQMDEASQKAWMAYMTPGNVHQMLAKSEGQWKEDVTMWMMPGQEPMHSTASATNKMIMGGRYQQSTHTGDMMGMPFEGMSVMGYDNAKKMFVSSWVDNMGTGMMNMEGTWDDATKSITMKGTTVEPMTGKDMNVREVFKFMDDNTQMLEMYMMMPDGKEFKSMEIKFTRM
ncbi:MAG: DUF1579 domain-containing protein [Parafilimonas sp.]